MKALILATCQGDALRTICRENPAFTRRYVAYVNVHNFEYIRQGRCFLDDETFMGLLRVADLFIYQPLGAKHGRNATANLEAQLKPTCIRIRVPYVTLTSLMPFVVARQADLGDDWHTTDEIVVENAEPLNALLAQDLGPTEILARYDAGTLDWRFTARHAAAMQVLRNKEVETDIQVCAYIDANLCTRRLFTYFSHPSHDLFLHMANQIFARLGLSTLTALDPELHLIYGAADTQRLHYQYPTPTVRHFGLTFVGANEMARGDAQYRERIVAYLVRRR